MKLLKCIIILSASFLLVACGGSSPKSVAAEFMNAMKNYDAETAKKYCTKGMGQDIDRSMGSYSDERLIREKEAAKDAVVKFIDAVAYDREESAIVTFEIAEMQQKKDTIKLLLKRENEQWKVYDFK